MLCYSKFEIYNERVPVTVPLFLKLLSFFNKRSKTGDTLIIANSIKYFS